MPGHRVSHQRGEAGPLRQEERLQQEDRKQEAHRDQDEMPQKEGEEGEERVGVIF